MPRHEGYFRSPRILLSSAPSRGALEFEGGKINWTPALGTFTVSDC